MKRSAAVLAGLSLAALTLLGVAFVVANPSPAFAGSRPFRSGTLGAAGSITRSIALPGVAREAARGVTAPGGGFRTDAWAGGGIPVSTGTAEQYLPAVISDASGASIISWIDVRAGNFDVYANRFDVNGNLAAGWNADGVPLVATAESDFPLQITSDTFGGVFVLFAAGDPSLGLVTGLYVKRFTSAGVQAPGWPDAGRTIFAGDHLGGGGFADGSGGLYVGWVEPDSTIRVVRIDGTGSVVSGWPSAGVQVAPSHLEYFGIDAAVATGGIYATWTAPDGLYAQRVTSSGTVAPGWPANGLHVYSGTLNGDDPSPAGTGSDLIVGWTETRSPGDGNLYAKRVTSAGVVDAAWPATGRAICSATGNQDNLQAIADPSGGALFMWKDARLGAFMTSIYAQRLTSGGAVAAGWTADGVDLLASGAFAPSSAFFGDGSGGIFAAWPQFDLSSNFGIYTQHLGLNGTAQWSDGGIAVASPLAPVSSSALASDAAGGVIVAWTDDRTGTIRVYAGRVQNDGTVEAMAALVSATAEPDGVELEWFAPAGASFSATLERAEPSTDYRAVADLAADATGRLSYADRDVLPGRTYEYRLAVLDDGALRYLGHAVVRVPLEPAAAIEGFLPNPATGAIQVAFTLPRSGAARLEVLDVAGRVRFTRDVGGLGAGRHVVTVDGVGLPAGTYLVRLTRDGRTEFARGVVLR